MKERGVPIVRYHGVGPDREGWPWNHLFTPADVFERQMRALRDEGWTTISLAELHAHMASGAPLPPKPVVLTFDDGYADNWVYAYPLLKKYGHRAAIWMSTDFVDPRGEPRSTIEEVWSGRLSEAALDPRGYLSWAEMWPDGRWIHSFRSPTQELHDWIDWYCWRQESVILPWGAAEPGLPSLF